jgi:hypothetical protein
VSDFSEWKCGATFYFETNIDRKTASGALKSHLMIKEHIRHQNLDIIVYNSSLSIHSILESNLPYIRTWQLSSSFQIRLLRRKALITERIRYLLHDSPPARLSSHPRCRGFSTIAKCCKKLASRSDGRCDVRKADNCVAAVAHANNSLVDWILWSTAQLAIF